VKQKTIGMKCPECSDGEIIERRSKKGKTFFGCNRYPDCEFVAEQADSGEVPGLWRRLSGREIPEGGSDCAVSEWRMQVQARR